MVHVLYNRTDWLNRELIPLIMTEKKIVMARNPPLNLEFLINYFFFSLRFVINNYVYKEEILPEVDKIYLI